MSLQTSTTRTVQLDRHITITNLLVECRSIMQRCVVALFTDAITTRTIQTTDDGIESGSLSSSSAAARGHSHDITETANTAAPMTIQSEPYQPLEIKYEKDHKNRSFQASWYQRWKWLDWNQTAGCVLCHPCKMAKQLGLLGLSKNAESTFSESGFCNWKDASRCFQRHEDSSSHSEAVMKWSSYYAGVNVATQINSKHSESQMVSREMLLKLLSSMRYLARQGLPLRGHATDDGNFYWLVCLFSEDDSDLQKWISQKKAYMSHDVQNECLQLMAHHVLRTLLTKIRNAQYYSIICDEVTDQARQHQLGISIRWIDENFGVQEDFVELGLLPVAMRKLSPR